MRKVFFIVGLLLLTAGIASAACNKFEVGGGYRYVRVSSSIGNEIFSTSTSAINSNGWDAEVAVNPACWLGIVGDFGGVYASPTFFGEPFSTHAYLETFGPRVNLHKSGPINPFVEALFGAGQFKISEGGESLSSNGFAGQYGGGVDVSFGGPFAVRGRIDDVMTHFGGQNQNSLGITAEVVYKFGGH
jgi:hypothetical protein